MTTDGGFLNGLPAVVTVGALGNLVLLDAAGIYVNDAGTVIDASRYAAIQAETAPSNPPTAATVLRDLWSHNEIGLRVERWVSWASESNAVAYVAV